MNGTLMAIGGFDGTTYLKTCELYDADANMWKLSGSMIYRRLGGGVGVVKKEAAASHGCLAATSICSTDSRTQTTVSITSKISEFFTYMAS